MKLARLPLDQAKGAILVHNVVGEDGRRLLRKGRALDDHELATLRGLGRRTVMVALLESDDLDEDRAATRVAEAVGGDLLPEEDGGPGGQEHAVSGRASGLRRSRALTGRVNFYAECRGLVRVDPERLMTLNGSAGITLATLLDGSVVQPGKMVATLKVIPYAVPGAVVERTASEARQGAEPLLRIDPLPRRRVSLVLTGSPGARGRIVAAFVAALGTRLEMLGSELVSSDFVATDEDAAESALARVLAERLEGGCDFVIVAGDTAIMDADDITPRAIVRVGATLECFGVPVDPGNLLLLAYHGDVPILGTPGCARSPKTNIVDLVLPRLLVGERLGRQHLLALGHGGLLEDVPERPFPRSRLG